MVFSKSFKRAVKKATKVAVTLIILIFVQAILFWLFEGAKNPLAEDPLEAFWFILFGR